MLIPKIHGYRYGTADFTLTLPADGRSFNRRLAGHAFVTRPAPAKPAATPGVSLSG